jgi:hypothetical protein
VGRRGRPCPAQLSNNQQRSCTGSPHITYCERPITVHPHPPRRANLGAPTPQVTLLTHAYPPSPFLPSPLFSPHPPRPLRLARPICHRAIGPFLAPPLLSPFSSFCSFGFEGIQSSYHPSATNQSSSRYLRTTSEDLADTLSLSVNNAFIHFKNFPTTESQSSTASTRLLPFLGYTLLQIPSSNSQSQPQSPKFPAPFS